MRGGCGRWIATLLFVVGACGGDPEDPDSTAAPTSGAQPADAPPITTPGPWYLLQEVDRAGMDSVLADQRAVRREPLELALTDLEVKGRSADGTTYELPLPFDDDVSGADRPQVIGPDDLSVDQVEWLSARHRYELADETYRASFRGFPRPRTPEGDVGVMIKADCAVELPLRRTGGPVRVWMAARFLGNWDPTRVPDLVFSLAGQEVHRIRWQEPNALQPFQLPAAMGTQHLRLEMGGVQSGPEAPKLVLHNVYVDELDGLDHMFLPAGVEATGLRARYPVKLPEPVQSLRSASQPPAVEVTARVQVVKGRAALLSSVVQACEIRTADGALLAAGTGVETAFEIDADGMLDLRVRGTAGPLGGNLLLVQPAAAFAGDLAATRGLDEPEERHALVTHVQADKDARRSLLLAPGTEVSFALAGRVPSELRFDVSAHLLAPQKLPVEVCPPPVLEVLVDGPDGRQPLGTVSSEATALWQSHALDVPADARHLILRCPPVTAAPVAGSLALLAVAQPRLFGVERRDVPNLVVYLIDTLRADRLSCYGHDRKTTPHIDALATDGVLFERAYSQAPWTRPSVATFFTGLLYSFHGAGKTSGLAPELETLTEVVHAGGYQSAAFIANAQIHGMGLNFVQGFNQFVAVEEVVGESRASDVNQLVLPWIDQHQDEPFFLYVHTIDPHAKYDPPPATAGTYNKGYDGKLNPRLTGSRNLEDQVPLSDADLQYILDLYDEEILFNDQEFGRMIAHLKERGLYENTVIVVVSDHGEEFGEHGQYGHGGRLWQELLHVPLIVKLAGEERPREVRVDSPVRVMDLFPTVVSALGLDLSPGVCQGVDLHPWWEVGPPDTPLDVIAEEQPAMRCLIRGPFKVIQEDYDRPKEVLHLYNLRDDPGEQLNLAPEHPELADQYLTHLLGILASYREAGFESTGSLLELELTDENLEALRAMGYIE